MDGVCVCVRRVMWIIGKPGQHQRSSASNASQPLRKFLRSEVLAEKNVISAVWQMKAPSHPCSWSKNI